MEPHLILPQYTQYADLINKALCVCNAMLSRNEVLYPFAAVRTGGETMCINLPDENVSASSQAPSHMIEKLEAQVASHLLHNQHSMSVIVYAATVVDQNKQPTDAIVLCLSDSENEHSVAIYPFQWLQNSISIGRPYTCDFSD